MLSCPMCGKQTSRRYFNPEDLATDILAVKRKSLGRGKGFAVTGRPSILDDKELVAKIAKRCHTLLELIEGKDSKGVSEELEELRSTIDEYEEERDLCLNLANEALPDEYEEYADLENAIQALATEFLEALEELED